MNVRGLQAGYRIQVYNSVGTPIRDIQVGSNIESISMSNEPAGIYVIVVSEDGNTLGRYKAIKQ